MTKAKDRLRDSKGRFVKTKKVAVVGNLDIPEVSSMPAVPEGMVRINDGRIINKTDRVFYLSETEENPNVMVSRDGATYQKKNGTLRRISPKLNKKQRRAVREEARSASHT